MPPILVCVIKLLHRIPAVPALHFYTETYNLIYYSNERKQILGLLSLDWMWLIYVHHSTIQLSFQCAFFSISTTPELFRSRYLLRSSPHINDCSIFNCSCLYVSNSLTYTVKLNYKQHIKHLRPRYHVTSTTNVST